jgi:predicted site-specific integrase-resolvase
MGLLEPTHQVEGVNFFPAQEIAASIGVSRQTLWRWRQDQRIPSGYRFRDGRLLFSEQELEEIFVYAQQVKPVKLDRKNIRRSTER